MKRFNRGFLKDYLTLQEYDYLYRNEEIKPVKQDSEINYDALLNSFLDAIEPWADMYKDITDTFKPYKSRHQNSQDFIQPIRGLGNIFKGLVFIVAAAIIAPFQFIFRTIAAIFTPSKFVSKTTFAIVDALTPFIFGINLLIRGAAQIATFPLTWMIKMPLRAAITHRGKSPLMEESERIKQFVTKGEDALNKNNQQSAAVVAKALHLKYEKAKDRSQSSAVDVSNENIFYKDIEAVSKLSKTLATHIQRKQDIKQALARERTSTQPGTVAINQFELTAQIDIEMLPKLQSDLETKTNEINTKYGSYSSLLGLYIGMFSLVKSEPSIPGQVPLDTTLEPSRP